MHSFSHPITSNMWPTLPIDHPDEIDAVLKYFDEHPSIGWQKLPEQARNEFIENERKELIEHIFAVGHQEVCPEHYEKRKKPQVPRGKK